MNQPCPGSHLRTCFQDPSSENRRRGESTRQQNPRLPVHAHDRGEEEVEGSSLLLWFRPELRVLRALSLQAGVSRPTGICLGVFQDLPRAPHAYQGRGPLAAEGTGSKQKLLDGESRGNILMVGGMETWVSHWVTGLSLSPGCVPLSLP